MREKKQQQNPSEWKVAKATTYNDNVVKSVYAYALLINLPTCIRTVDLFSCILS